MPDWGGLLAGAIGGAGQAVANQATGYIEDARKVDVAKQMADIELQARNAAAQYSDQLSRDRAVFDVSDPTLTAAQDQRQRAKGQIANDLEVQRIKDTSGPMAAAAAAQAKAVGQVATDLEISRGNNPLYTAALHKIAQASHVFTPQEGLAAEQLKLAVMVDTVRMQLANEKNADKREELTQRLNDLQGTTKSRNDLALALNQTHQAIAKARATLSDPLAPKEAKDGAEASIATLTQSAEFIMKQMGVKPGPGGPPPPQAAIDYLNKHPGTAAQFEQMYPGYKAAGFLGNAPRASGPNGTAAADFARPAQPGIVASSMPSIVGLTPVGANYVAKMNDGSERQLSAAAATLWQKMQSGEPTSPGERAAGGAELKRLGVM